MESTRQVVQLESAGGVVYRETARGVEVVLCGARNPRMWRLPKGTPDPGETREETALREVCEETGLEVELLDTIGSIQYQFTRPGDGAICHKTVHFYLMAPTGGDLSLHDNEFDVVEWFPVRPRSRLAHIQERGRYCSKGYSGSRPKALTPKSGR